MCSPLPSSLAPSLFSFLSLLSSFYTHFFAPSFFFLALSLSLSLSLLSLALSLSSLLSLSLSSLLSSSLFSLGRGMKDPARGHVRDTTALPWKKKLSHAIMTTQRQQLVACCLSNQTSPVRAFVTAGDTEKLPRQCTCQTTQLPLGAIRRHRSHPLGANPYHSPPCPRQASLSVILRNRLSRPASSNPPACSPSIFFVHPIADFWILLFLLAVAIS